MDQATFDLGGGCEVCRMLVRYIDGILENNATEAQILDAVRKVCNFLPPAVHTEVSVGGRLDIACEYKRCVL